MLEHSSTHMIHSTMAIGASVQGSREHAAICQESVHGKFQRSQEGWHPWTLSNHDGINDEQCLCHARALIYTYDMFDDGNLSFSTRFKGTCGDMSRKCSWHVPTPPIRMASVNIKQSWWYQSWAMFVSCSSTHLRIWYVRRWQFELQYKVQGHMQRYVKKVFMASSNARNKDGIREHYAIMMVSMMSNVCVMLEHSSMRMIHSTMAIPASVQGSRAHAAICQESVHGKFQRSQ